VEFASEVRAAVVQADFVQESAPDDEKLKTDLIAQIDQHAHPDVVIASSTSGIMPSRLQSTCTHPERVLAGHPFNPVHILPLVEVVAGELTSPTAVDQAMAFYRSLGKRPLRVRKEVPGFVSNRLQEALWREMFHIVNDGVATTAELDAAITDGPGLRLALYGPAFVYYLQGGRGGMGHALAQFDPDRIPDWSHNYYPELHPELVRLLDEQTREQAEGRSFEEWERLRDEFLIRVLEVRGEIFDRLPASTALAR
jgi:carnitine 3-dehydrogenase